MRTIAGTQPAVLLYFWAVGSFDLFSEGGGSRTAPTLLPYSSFLERPLFTNMSENINGAIDEGYVLRIIGPETCA